MDFSNWALNNRKLINFFIICLCIGGVLSFRDMPKLEDPELKVKQAMVVTTYPGASAHEVELEVTDKIEKSIHREPIDERFEHHHSGIADNNTRR